MEHTLKIMRKYVDILIVVIKIAEIKEAAKCIEPYVHNLSIPIIPVLIKVLIPSLVNHEIRTIAFSSKTKHNSRGSLFTTKIVKKNWLLYPLDEWYKSGRTTSISG